MSKDTTTDGTILVDSESAYPFTIVPNYLITNKKLKCETRMAWIYLYSRINCKNWVARPFDIQKMLGISDYTWRKVSIEMQENGYLTVSKVKGTAFKFNPKGNSLVDFKPQVKAKATEDKAAAPDVDFNVCSNIDQTLNSQTAKTQTVKSTDIERKDLLENKDVLESKDLITQAQVQEMFDRLWKDYPLKKNKQTALKAFSKFFKGQSMQMAQEIAATIVRGFKANLDERDALTQLEAQGVKVFIPEMCHFATWINQKRWEDEYQTPEQILKKAVPKHGVDLDAFRRSYGE